MREDQLEKERQEAEAKRLQDLEEAKQREEKENYERIEMVESLYKICFHFLQIREYMTNNTNKQQIQRTNGRM